MKIQDAKLRAKHTAEAVALYANQSRRVYQLSAEEQMGSDGLDMMITFGIPLHEVLPWKWFWFYKPHQTAFNRARTYFAKDLAHSHAGLLSTGTSEQALLLAVEMLEEVFDIKYHEFESGLVVGTPRVREEEGDRLEEESDEEEVERDVLSEQARLFLANRAHDFAFAKFSGTDARKKYTVPLVEEFAKKLRSPERIDYEDVIAFTRPALVYLGIKPHVKARGANRKGTGEYRLSWVWTIPRQLDKKKVKPPTPLPSFSAPVEQDGKHSGGPALRITHDKESE